MAAVPSTSTASSNSAQSIQRKTRIATPVPGSVCLPEWIDYELTPVTGIVCPSCNHRYEVIESRAKMFKPRFKRWLYSYYRCRVCDYRFRQTNVGSVLTIVATSVAFFILAIVMLIIAL